MGRRKKIKYEDKIDVIDEELSKRKNKWFLDSIPWVSFEDVEQIIRLHIYQKWDKWDQKRDLKPWVNKIITNQFKNILRNYYLNFARPCVGCPFNTDTGSESNSCSFTKTGAQDHNCPLFKKWSKTKKYAHDVKIPSRIDAASFDFLSSGSESFDITVAMRRVEKELKDILSEKMYNIYYMLFIDNKTEDEVASFLGYKSNEKGRAAGYKQIKNIKKKIKEQVIKIIKNEDIFYD